MSNLIAEINLLSVGAGRLLSGSGDDNVNSALQKILDKLTDLIDSFWIYIILALAAIVVVWGAYIGVRIAIAHRNEEKINARDMVKNLLIGILVIFVVALGVPLLIEALSAWVG
ncbi:MAG: hypothetical protein LUD29_06350 [Clostridia bacterium]|nr:hypothetical protein [Clostridia bacterium]